MGGGLPCVVILMLRHVNALCHAPRSVLKMAPGSSKLWINSDAFRIWALSREVASLAATDGNAEHRRALCLQIVLSDVVDDRLGNIVINSGPKMAPRLQYHIWLWQAINT